MRCDRQTTKAFYKHSENGCEELTDMNDEAETKAIEKWLRVVDKPLERKEADDKDAEPIEESGNR